MTERARVGPLASPDVQSARPLLAVRELRTDFVLRRGRLRAVNGVSFDLHRGEAVGLVGESGCGKSVTALSLLRLVPKPGVIAGGTAYFDGVDLLSCSKETLRKIRGRRISLVFQDASTALNPMLNVGLQMREILQIHMDLSRKEALRRSADLLSRVGIPEPERTLRSYPHELSGGMRQRVMIAIALSCEPDLVLADEPTTALDVTIQAQILELLTKMGDELGVARLIITHDLALVARYTSRVLVMYAGRIVEEGETRDIFNTPRHPYTAGLLESTPTLDLESRDELKTIPGAPPDPLDLPSGCRFAPRCTYAEPRCLDQDPELEPVSPSHRVACWVKPHVLRPK